MDLGRNESGNPYRRKRVPNWELLLARVQVFGFTIRDDGSDMIEVERDGRVCTVDLATTVRYRADDPRDFWLLSMALEDGTQWAASETYFIRKEQDDEYHPVVLLLGGASDQGHTPFLFHGLAGAPMERVMLPSTGLLLEALPSGVPSNSVGYHGARQRIIDCYERLRPRTWSDVGITDTNVIAAYAVHGVSANYVAHAAEDGIIGLERIIAVFGMPADDEWK